MRVKFIIRNLAIYISSFTLPVIILGLIIIIGSYKIDSGSIERQMAGTLDLSEGVFRDMEKQADALNRYLVESGQMAFFYQIFIKEKVDYASHLAIKHIGSYLISETASNLDIDSVYFYIENQLERVITSERNIVQISSMGDRDWVNEFEEMRAGEKKVMLRSISKDEYSPSTEVFSLFLKFSSWNGGIVINYKKQVIEEKLSQYLFYGEQHIVVRNECGEVILSDENTGHYPVGEGGKKRDKEYLILRKRYAPFGIEYITYRRKNLTFASLSNVWAVTALVLATVLSSVILAYHRSIYSYKQLYSIFDIFDKAERNEELPQVRRSKNDLYSAVLNNLIYLFIENRAQFEKLQESKYKQIVAEEAALQYQISPHFLFNTIQAINYEILKINHSNYTNTNRMLENLSDILRYTLGSPREKVSVYKEIEMCKKYITIQCMRYNRQFDVKWLVNTELEMAMIPKMILQPLLENSISHGLRFKEEKCKIFVKVNKKSNKMRICIMDNGSGISEERLKEIRAELSGEQLDYKDKHIGLNNVNQRLKLEYQEFKGIHISSKPGLGTVVCFEVPS